MNQLTIAAGCPSYPGLYAPASDVTQIFEKMKSFRRQKHTTLHAAVNEYAYQYKIVIPLKNIQKGDLVAMIHERRLIIVSKNKLAISIKGFRPLPGTRFTYGTLPLPGDVDAEFSCAAYRDASLEVHLSKSKFKTDDYDHLILIY